MSATTKKKKVTLEKDMSGPYLESGEEERSITIEELEETLAQTRKELASSKEEAKELGQQLATTIPRSHLVQIRRELEVKIEELIRENQELVETVEEERKEREWVEKELRAQYDATALTDKEMTNLQEFIKRLNTLQEEKGKAVEVQKEEKEAIARLLEETKEEVGRIKKESAMKTRTLTRLDEAQKELAASIKIKEEEVVAFQKEAATSRRHYDQLHKELRRQAEKRTEVEQHLKLVRGQVKVATDQAKARGRQESIARRQIDRLSREKEGLQRNLVKTAAQERKQSGLVLLGEKEKQKSKDLLVKTLLDLHQQDKLVVELQDARERQMEVTAGVETKVVELAAEVESREKEVDDIYRRNILLKTNLDRYSAVTDALRSENFATTRHLNILKAEKLEEEEKIKQLSYLTYKLSEVCDDKDKKITNLLTEEELQKSQQQNLRQKIVIKEDEKRNQNLSLQFMEGEKLCLQRIVEKQEVSLEGLGKIFREERNQRGMELTTLNRRNDEVCALQSRVKLLEHILRRGNTEYATRLKEIKYLTTELASLKKVSYIPQDEKGVLLRQVSLVKPLKEELVRQQKLLTSALKKQTCLENVIINNKSFHPRTTQQVSNADSFELLKKNQHLQKRYLAAMERIAALENEVSQRARDELELRKLTERTSAFYESNPDNLMSRIRLQNKLWAKEEQLKSVTAALNSALLRHEELEQEKKQMKAKIDHLTVRRNQLQKKLLTYTKQQTKSTLS